MRCEFALIRYVPDPVRGEFVNIGVVLREAEADIAPRVQFTRDWGRVRCVDALADVEMLESLEAEMRAQLSREPRGEKPLLQLMEDTLSNSLQMTAMQGTLAESVPAAMERLLRLYVEPWKSSGARRKPAGRGAILGQMRTEFQRTGVWDLMRKKVAASAYTDKGDPLKLDCGYRNGQVRLFHAVSLETDVEAAKGLAFSAPALHRGVLRVDGLTLELTAIVEPLAQVSDGDLYGFGVEVMEEAGVRVLTVADLSRVAETAQRTLRV